MCAGVDAKQRESVLDAFFEHLVGELPIGKRPRELNRAGHHREGGQHPRARGLGIFRHEACRELITWN